MFNDIITTDRTTFAIAAAIYGAAFLFGLISLLMRRAYSRTIMFALLCGGFLVQTIALNLRGTEIKACPLGNPFEITQFLAWSLVLLFFIIGPAFRLRLLGGFTAGLATLLVAGSLALPSWDAPYPPASLGTIIGSSYMPRSLYLVMDFSPFFHSCPPCSSSSNTG